jgi:predicted MFS family arabinose efflux permease
MKSNNELRNFYLLQFGQFISQLGSKMTSFGLIMWAYEQTGSVLSTSSLTLCTLLPSTLLSFFAGSFIDSWKKKKVMLVCNVVSTILSLATLMLLFSDRLSIIYLYLINFTFGVVDAFQDPASNVMITLIVPKEYYTKISGFRSLTTTFTTTFAPIIATSLYALLGLKAIVTIDLFSFIFAFIVLLIFVHVPSDVINKPFEKVAFSSNCRKGIDYIASKKDILHLIIYMAFINFIAAIYSCNFAPMILSRSGDNKLQLGFVSSMVGISGIIGSILVTLTKEPKKRVPVMINTMLFSFIVCNGMLGIGRNYYIWSLAVFMGNCLVPFLTANVEYIMRTKIPVEMQGRVFAARNTLQYFTIPLGYIVGGLLTDKLLEPFMNKTSLLQQFLSYIVGSGKGAGSGLIYVIIALLGAAGCCYFKFDKHLKSLDDETL